MLAAHGRGVRVGAAATHSSTAFPGMGTPVITGESLHETSKQRVARQPLERLQPLPEYLAQARTDSDADHGADNQNEDEGRSRSVSVLLHQTFMSAAST